MGGLDKPSEATKPTATKSITYVEIRVYEDDKLMELRRHPITYIFPNSTDEIIIAPKVLRAGEYPHDDQVTLFGFKVEIEAALQHIRVNDMVLDDPDTTTKPIKSAQEGARKDNQ